MRASLCLYISVFVSSVHARFSPLEAPSCSMETAEGVILPCRSSFAYKETCKLPDAKTSKDSSTSSSSSSSLLVEGEEEEEITLREKVITSSNSVIDVHFPLWQTRRSAVVVMRVQHQRQRRWRWRCLVMMVVTNEPGNVTLHDMTLPHGSYEVRVFKEAEGKRRGGGGGIGVKQLSRRFIVPSRVRQWRAPLSRQRRHKELDGRRHVATQDLILRNLGNDEHEEAPITSHDSYVSNEELGRYGLKEREGSRLCLCCKCFQFLLDYDENKAVLTFSYTLNSTCDEACSVVNVQLYRDNTSGTEQQCESGEPMLLLKGVERIGLDKNVTEGPIRYGNIGHGCYFVELKPQMYRMPERTRLFWARPAINVTDMNAWSTIFFLEPDPERRSMSVRWSVSEVYNFTAYQLTIHHHPSLRINCTGRAIYPNMTIIPPHNRLITTEPEYIFHNLSSGWYCARVTPQDDRCPLDGCQVLSSPPRRLDEPVSWGCEHDEGGTGDCDEGSALGLILLVAGCVLGALVTGVAVAWGLLHTWPTLSHMFSSSHYSPVPLRMEGGKAGVVQRQLVLVVWTLQGPNGAAIGPIMTAFKTLLRTYANCEVYDYLELSSLPEKQQMRLLSSPTAWLDSILASHSIKILIVATEGAWQRQLEWKQLAPQTRPRQENGLVSTPANAHDQVLFPYLLRRLHDQPELAGNYSRLFHVRFSEVSAASVELTHIVSLKRYRIPEHLQSLAVSLHGGTASASFEEPKEEQLTDLRTALASHPDFCSHSDGGNSPQWPGLVNGGQLKATDIANGCVKSSEESSSSPSPVVNGCAKPGVSDRGSTT